MDEPKTISEIGHSCQRQFETLIEAFTKVNGERRGELSRTAIMDERGRFRVWATNIGALNVGRASLDYRLKDAQYLQQNVKSLLEDLKESLSEGTISIKVGYF